MKGLEDANKALLIDDNSSKGYFRRYQGYKNTGRLEEAAADLKTILKIEPQNNEVKLYQSI